MNLALNSIEGINASDARDFGRRRTPAEYDVFRHLTPEELESYAASVLAFPDCSQVSVVQEHYPCPPVGVTEPYERPKISLRGPADLNAVECSLVV